MNWNKTLGAQGESHVARWLEDHGVVIVARNWRGRGGEVDLIGDDGVRLRIVEVKTRAGEAFGHPLEAIDEQKYKRLWRLGQEFRSGFSESRQLVVDAAAVLRKDGRFTVDYLADVRP